MAAKVRTELDVGADGVAVITIYNPPVNSLSIDVLHSLKESYEEALRRNDVKAIVVTGKGGKFSGGFDISSFGGVQGGQTMQPKVGYIAIDILTDTVEAATKPSVAAIDGLALGGGLEVAMACHARIATPTAQLGLPELQLGIIPGFGGTQRLPRLVGLTKSLEMMLLSKPIKGGEAHQLGLVDALVSPNDLVNTARQWALDIYECRRPWIKSLYKTDKLEPLGEAREILKFARAQAQKQAANLHHPLVCIDVIEEGIVAGPRAGLWKEATSFQELLFSDTCKSLVHVFFSQRATSKIPGATDLGLMPRKITKVAILGGGLMGSGIATAMAVIENVKLKQQIFSDLEKYCPSHCILATNTSTIDLNLIGEKTKAQDRIAGAHFFSPAHVMPLLEIVRTQHTSPQVVVDLLDVGKKIKKTPIVVGNCTGFAVNRMFFPYTQSALFYVDLGMDVYKIDRACTKFGMPMGPFRLADLVGFGVAVATGMQYLENFPERVYKSMLLPLMMEGNRAGEATQKGFYKYEGKRKATPDPEIMKYIEKSRSMAGVTPDPELMKLSEKDIVEMVFFPVINEACRVLDEGIAVKASDLDIASIFGMGFPPYRGGVMHWADSIGAKYIHGKLEEWTKRYGGFFKPCSYLAERAAKGIPLSAPTKKVQARL
ncbi:enoyl-CoA hydratase1 [Zea mays]|uniref:Enoyl-CoA hydratase1 n=1 Tax=Zea mays TaxID=4577 RepID=A0A1D6FI29_MAIZE|nr:enoyl-CoA hydratase1 [Zea mays]AQK91462.1 enoyl-CoA hydratase1 [Zea mays]